MYKLTLLLAVSILSITTGSAQAQKESPCSLRFAVAEKSGSGADRWGAWPEDATKWWVKDGKKKFPELCEANREDADFVITWQRDQTTQKSIQTPIPTSEVYSTDHFEYRDDAICYPDPNGFAGYECKPTFSHITEYHEEQVERLSLTVHRVQSDKLVPLKAVVKSGGKPGKASFQSAMKALRKETKKAGTLKIKK